VVRSGRGCAGDTSFCLDRRCRVWTAVRICRVAVTKSIPWSSQRVIRFDGRCSVRTAQIAEYAPLACRSVVRWKPLRFSSSVRSGGTYAMKAEQVRGAGGDQRDDQRIEALELSGDLRKRSLRGARWRGFDESADRVTDAAREAPNAIAVGAAA